MAEAAGDALPERARTRSSRVLVFCGGKGGTGRTTLAAALAVAAIEAGLHVRLIDADGATAGLTGLLAAGDASLRACLLPQDDFEVAVDQAQAAIAAEPGPRRTTGAVREEALRLLLRTVSSAGLHDLVLVDAPAGIGLDSLALAGAADGVLLVADPASLGAGQAKRFMTASSPDRPAHATAQWCGVIVNQAPAGMDGSDLAAVARDIGPAVDRVALVRLDANGWAHPRPHEALAADRPATRFADDAMRAFDALLADERAVWPEAARERWRALVAAKAREFARADAQREHEAAAQRKRLDRWPGLEEECQRLATELERVRAAHADDLLRQGRQAEELRIQVRVLRAALEAAQARASVRRTRGIAAVGLGFASGALLALIALVSIGPLTSLDALEGSLPLMAGLLSGRQAPAPPTAAPHAHDPTHSPGPPQPPPPGRSAP